MQIRIHVETLGLESAAVVVQEVSHEPGVKIVVQDNGGLDSNSKRRDVCTDANAGKRRLTPFGRGRDAVTLRVASEAPGSGASESRCGESTDSTGLSLSELSEPAQSNLKLQVELS